MVSRFGQHLCCAVADPSFHDRICYLPGHHFFCSHNLDSEKQTAAVPASYLCRQVRRKESFLQSDAPRTESIYCGTEKLLAPGNLSLQPGAAVVVMIATISRSVICSSTKRRNATRVRS